MFDHKYQCHHETVTLRRLFLIILSILTLSQKGHIGVVGFQFVQGVQVCVEVFLK